MTFNEGDHIQFWYRRNLDETLPSHHTQVEAKGPLAQWRGQTLFTNQGIGPFVFDLSMFVFPVSRDEVIKP